MLILIIILHFFKVPPSKSFKQEDLTIQVLGWNT